MPGQEVIPCWCLGSGWTAAVEAAALEREEEPEMMKTILFGSGVNDDLAREAEAADLACREEQLQRAIEAAQSEESYRPTKARRR